MDFGKSFKFYRQRANLTQKEAADLIGIKDYQLGNYETNRSQPSLEILLKMSKAYLVSIDKMLGNDPRRNKQDKEREKHSKEYIDIKKVLEMLSDYVEQEKNSKE